MSRSSSSNAGDFAGGAGSAHYCSQRLHNTVGQGNKRSGIEPGAFACKGTRSKGKVTNLVDVGGVHQVMLEVRVAEMSKSLTRRLGINLGYSYSTTFQRQHPTKSDDGCQVGFAAVNALFRFSNNGSDWTAFVDALKQDGLIKVLAEPNLVALSGQTATFLAGGEFPIPFPQSGGGLTPR